MIKFNLLIVLAFLYLMPQFVFVSFSLSSIAVGIILASLLIIVISEINAPKISVSGICVFLLFMLYILATFLFNVDSLTLKAINSAAILFIMYVAVCRIASIFIKLDCESVIKTFIVFSWVLLLLGFVQIFVGFNFPFYANQEKPVFPFSEESHYALAVGLITGTAYVNSANKCKFIVFCCVVFQALAFPSLTLLSVACVLAYIFWGMNIRAIFFYPVIIGLLVFLIVANAYIDADSLVYFKSRLSISLESKNLTTLVFIQGWEQALISLKETYGVGIGFQMFGTESPGVASSKIASIAGFALNREDGGFLSAKLIGEFGFVGVLISMVYAIFIVFSSSIYHYYKKRLIGVHVRKFNFLVAIVIMFSIEFFLRGYGYFSPGLLLFCGAVFAIRKLLSLRISNQAYF